MKIRFNSIARMAYWYRFRLVPFAFKRKDGGIFAIGVWGRLGWRYWTVSLESTP